MTIINNDVTKPSISASNVATITSSLRKIEEELMQQKHMERIIQNIKDTIKDFNLQDGDIFTLSDENHRVSVSPYRVTMEIRFPDGVNNAKD